MFKPAGAAGTVPEFRTKPVKKTTTPVWNEELRCVVNNVAHLLVSVFSGDGAYGGDQELLGSVDISFADLDLKPGAPKEVVCDLMPQGRLSLELEFLDDAYAPFETQLCNLARPISLTPKAT